MSAPRPPALASLSRLLSQAESLLAAQRFHDALPLLLQAQALAPAEAEVQRLLATRAIMLADAPLAVKEAERATALAPGRADLWMLLGRAHKLADDVDAALPAYRRAVALDPDLAPAHVSLGIALKAAGQLDEAVAAYRQALRITPGLAVAHINLANALVMRHQAGLSAQDGGADAQAQAIATAQRALALEPHNEHLLRAVVGILHQLGRHDLALALLGPWLAGHPPATARTLNLMTSTLMHLGRPGEALGWARRAQAQDPRDAEAMAQLGSLLVNRLAQDEGLALLERAHQLDPALAETAPSLAMAALYQHDDPARVAAAQQLAATRLRPRPPGAAPELVPLGARSRLRVGLLSGDLRRHSVAYFIEPLLGAIDPTRLELWAYSNHRVHDEVSARLQASVAHWLPCAEMDDAALWRRIRQDRIDVLIDLAGWTHDGRPAVFAWRAAPMQVEYLGYPTSGGIAQIDFRITDGVIDPPAADPSPALLRCAASMFCFGPEPAPPQPEPPCIPRGFITFGSFNNIAKWSQATLDLWAQVLLAVPASRLLLKTRTLEDRDVASLVRQRFAAWGIGPDRLQLEGYRGDTAQHLAAYRDVDIALDCFPYNGATTTCEALWCGVPVISLRGHSHASRMGASILSALGRASWVTDSPEAFVAAAKQLAQRPAELSDFRAGAQTLMRASPLMDARAFARRFETLLFGGWEQLGNASAARVG